MRPRRALVLIERAPGIDLGVLDVDLEGEAVYPVADVLAGCDVLFLLVAGHGRDPIPERYRDAPTLQKPVMTRKVLAAIRRLAV